MSKAQITTTDAPIPKAPFSQGVAKNGIVQVSGQTGVDAATGVLADGVESQTTRSLENVAAILTAGGAQVSDVISLRVYLTDPGDFAAMNGAYETFLRGRLGEDAVLPCRTTIMCALAKPELLVEIDAMAVVDH